MVVMMSVRLYMISRPLKVIWALTHIVKGTLHTKNLVCSTISWLFTTVSGPWKPVESLAY